VRVSCVMVLLQHAKSVDTCCGTCMNCYLTSAVCHGAPGDTDRDIHSGRIPRNFKTEINFVFQTQFCG
jgi:hypothetical protein